MAIKYPHIEVKLSGEEGNAFAILGAVDDVLRDAKIPQSERDAFDAEATSDDYEHLLRVVHRWVRVT